MTWFLLFLFLFGLFHAKLYDGSIKDLPDEFDFIIVGGGLAGSVLANRLSEDPDVTILVLEAGSKDRDVPESSYIKTPVLFPNLFPTDLLWKYKTEPQKYAFFGKADDSAGVEMGRVLGGSSSVNAMVFERGFKTDFDSWAEKGAEGWSYEDVLPYILRVEGKRQDSEDTDQSFGHVTLSDATRTPPVNLAFEAAKEAGITEASRQNPNPLGVFPNQFTIGSGIRKSASDAYLWPVMYRPNLHVVTGAHVITVVVENKTKQAVGVMYIHEANDRITRARQEVILSAGPYGSPKILMFSGVGPAKHLGNIGINMLVDLPVGLNLEQHLLLKLPIHVDMQTLGLQNFSNRAILEDYVFHRKGPFNGLVGIAGLNCYLQFQNLKTERDKPMANVVFVDGNFDAVLSNKNKDKCSGLTTCDDQEQSESIGTITALTFDTKPKSRGYVQLRRNNYTDLPIINPNFLSSRFDVLVFLESIRFVQKMLKTPSFRSVNARFPSLNTTCLRFSYDTDAYWECFIRHFVIPTYHGVGTCRMGEGSNTVVDSKLRVKGIRGLRVVDASVMPSIPSTFPQATVYMIAEKAAHIIKEETKLSERN